MASSSSPSPTHWSPNRYVLESKAQAHADRQIDIYSLPSQSRLHTIHPGKGNGMAMSLALINRDGLTLLAAFENGYASVHRLQDGQWITTYRSQAHTQPVLSLAVHDEWFLTSSADAIIAKHPLSEATAPQTVNTRHAGQQSVAIRSDGRIFATAGWDSHVRVYSCKTLKELAVLQWHKVGCYAVALATVDTTGQHEDSRTAKARTTHWIAAGAKDGKISLWDIY
jgi:WD40 repeat protein